VLDLFSGYAGHVQADAKSVFDVLFRTDSCKEVGCWAHARRKYWDAAFAGSAVAREALLRMGRIFELDASYKDLPLHRRKEQRQQHLLPHVESLLAWAEAEYARVAKVRGTLRDALGYTVRQKDALRTFLQDARLEMTNNGSERELRQVVVGRKAWLFFGSQEHAESAGELMSIIASARLHKLNPQQYLTELIRVLPHWPTRRYLELSTARWEATRERLSPDELALEIGPLTVPPPMEQQRRAD
jgi:transposase